MKSHGTATDSMYAAEFFALVAAQKFDGEPVVLKVDVKGMKHMLKVRSETINGGGFRVFDMYREIFFTEPIPPNRIRIGLSFQPNQHLCR